MATEGLVTPPSGEPSVNKSTRLYKCWADLMPRRRVVMGELIRLGLMDQPELVPALVLDYRRGGPEGSLDGDVYSATVNAITDAELLVARTKARVDVLEGLLEGRKAAALAKEMFQASILASLRAEMPVPLRMALCHGRPPYTVLVALDRMVMLDFAQLHQRAAALRMHSQLRVLLSTSERKKLATRAGWWRYGPNMGPLHAAFCRVVQEGEQPDSSGQVVASLLEPWWSRLYGALDARGS